MTVAACCASAAAAQAYPAKPVRIVVPFPAGGPADMLARLLAEKLPERLGQPVLVDNVGGAAGNIGAEQVARAPNDGHVLLLNASSHVINGILYAKLPYDPIRDFTPVTQVASYNHMLVVHPGVPARTLREFVALAKAKPGSLSVGNSGVGTPGHLAAELFKTTAGIDYVHVSYKGSAPATTDLLGGQVQAMFNNPVNTLPFTAAGKMRAIAVTGKQRLAVAPDVPTVAESGYPGFEAGTWFGIFGPAQMPAAAVSRMQEEVARALRLPDARQKLAAQAWDVITNTPAEFAAVIRSDHEIWTKVIRSAGIRSE
ncbi:MAG: tripartite tricarboxylate transporter substrate binding protein [Burkholderiales bacterium]|nr:tripartite tricarboxylate transporter substrate binding protein [Burkholderiales bacterium]